MNTNINEIFSNIDEATADSEACVLESMLMSYIKTYDMLTNEEGLTIVQEAVEADAKKKNKNNVFIKIIDSILAFFKKIGKAISSFFSKAKDTIVEKLRKFSKPNNASDEAIKTAQEKADKISDKKSESLEKLTKPEMVEEEKKSKEESKTEKQSKKTGVVVKERKIKTRIKFQTWVKYLEDTNTDLDNFLSNKFKLEKIKIKAKDKYLYSFFSHKYPASEVADYVEKIIELIKAVNLKLTEAEEKMSEVKKFYNTMTETINSNEHSAPWFKNDSKRKEIERHITNYAASITNVTICIQNMTGYLANELDIYGIILDTIEPVISKHKAEVDAKAAAEEAKKKAAEKEARTQHIEVHVKKDDE